MTAQLESTGSEGAGGDFSNRIRLGGSKFFGSHKANLSGCKRGAPVVRIADGGEPPAGKSGSGTHSGQDQCLWEVT